MTRILAILKSQSKYQLIMNSQFKIKNKYMNQKINKRCLKNLNLIIKNSKKFKMSKNKINAKKK